MISFRQLIFKSTKRTAQKRNCNVLKISGEAYLVIKIATFY